MSKSLLGVVALVVTGAATPLAAAPAINLLTPGLEYPGTQYTLGFEFSVAAASTIDELGVYDNLGDGLTASANIGIWDLSGSLLTSTTIAAGGGVLNGLFRYASITPFALTPGTHYIVGAYTTDLASSLNTGQGGTGTYNPLVTVYQDRYSNFNSAFSFPDTTQGSVQGAWLGGNFNLATVPEPAAWTLMIGGFAMTGTALRRRSVGVRA